MAKKKLKSKPSAAKKSRRPASKSKSKTKSLKPAKKAASKKSVKRSTPRIAGTSTRPKWISEGSSPVSPLLIVRDVEAALDFYQTVFGFRITNLMKGPNNSIVHAEMTYRDSLIMMNPENPELGAFAPQGPSPVTLYVYVADVDAVADLARLNGGNVARQPVDMFWGDRCSVIIDPDGHSWTIATHFKDIAVEDLVLPPPVN